MSRLEDEEMGRGVWDRVVHFFCHLVLALVYQGFGAWAESGYKRWICFGRLTYEILAFWVIYLGYWKHSGFILLTGVVSLVAYLALYFAIENEITLREEERDEAHAANRNERDDLESRAIQAELELARAEERIERLKGTLQRARQANRDATALVRKVQGK